LMLLFSWYIADPIISVIVALLILKSAWGIVNQTVHILMEGTPQTINFLEVHQTLQDIHGVIKVHDLHVWTITSGLYSLSCHLLINDNCDEQVILQEAIKRTEGRFNIHHTTIQVEKSQFQHDEMSI